MPPCHLTDSFGALDPRDATDQAPTSMEIQYEQAYFPAQQPTPRQSARFPSSYAYSRGSRHPRCPPSQGPHRALRVTPCACPHQQDRARSGLPNRDPPRSSNHNEFSGRVLGIRHWIPGALRIRRVEGGGKRCRPQPCAAPSQGDLLRYSLRHPLRHRRGDPCATRECFSILVYPEFRNHRGTEQR